MKKIIAFLAAFVLAMSALAALAEDPAVYLALGDSITTGYGLAEGEMCFAELVAQANGYALINRAVNGNTAAGILAQLADPATLMDVLRADVITITCGGNDMMGLLYQQIAEVYNALIPAQMPMLMVESGDVTDIMTNGEDPRQQALLLAALTVLEGNAEMGIEPFVQSAAMREGLTSYLTTLGVVVMSLRRANPEASIIVATQYNPYNRFDGAFAALNAGMESGPERLHPRLCGCAGLSAGGRVCGLLCLRGEPDERLHGAPEPGFPSQCGWSCADRRGVQRGAQPCGVIGIK